MTVVRVKTATGWVDLTVGGPQGATEAPPAAVQPALQTGFSHYAASSPASPNFGPLRYTKYANGLVLVHGLWLRAATLAPGQFITSGSMPTPADGQFAVFMCLFQANTKTGIARVDLKQNAADGNKWQLVYTQSWYFGDAVPSGTANVDWVAMQHTYRT